MKDPDHPDGGGEDEPGPSIAMRWKWAFMTLLFIPPLRDKQEEQAVESPFFLSHLLTNTGDEIKRSIRDKMMRDMGPLLNKIVNDALNLLGPWEMV